MSTNPQTPKASRSTEGAEGSQSHPHPVAEGRQSPGLEEALRRAMCASTLGSMYAAVKDAWAALASPGTPQGGLRDGEEWCKTGLPTDGLAPEESKEEMALYRAQREKMRPGPAMTREDAFWEGWMMKKKSLVATPSQEEGPAGVDLCPICDSAMDSLPNTRLACPRNPECPMPIVWRSDLPKIRRLRAQAPASSPRPDLSTHPCHGEAARIYSALPPSGLPVEETPIANRVALKLFSYAYGLETEIGRLHASSPRDLGGDTREAFREALRVYRLNLHRWDAATNLADKQRYMAWMNEAEEKLFSVLAHPPKGETPSEAAGLETVAKVMAVGLKAAYNWHKAQLASEASRAGHPVACLPEGEGMAVLEGIQQWDAWNATPDQNRIKTGSADTMLAIQLEFERLYTPHKAELRKAMVEWTKHRTPNDLLALMRANLAPAAPGTPIEKAAREFVAAARALIEAGNPILQREMSEEEMENRAAAEDAAWTNLCVAVDGWKPDARASLSSLPQEGAAGLEALEKEIVSAACLWNGTDGNGDPEPAEALRRAVRAYLFAPPRRAQEGAAGEGEPLPSVGGASRLTAEMEREAWDDFEDDIEYQQSFQAHVCAAEQEEDVSTFQDYIREHAQICFLAGLRTTLEARSAPEGLPEGSNPSNPGATQEGAQEPKEGGANAAH